MRIVYFGSGEFGLPTLKRLLREHEVTMVVTQPDRPAGRSRALTTTPIGVHAASSGAHLIKPERINDADVVEAIRGVDAHVFVVIAYGQKLGRPLLDGRFAINLHASLLPKYRGAAPINWAIIRGERSTGVSVITLADRMDAGDVLGQSVTPIDPMETAGELHDRLASLGPDLVTSVLSRLETGALFRQVQNESLATPAPKLSKSDGTVSFDQPADMVRGRIHGLTPWPGCTVICGGVPLKLCRVQVATADETAGLAPGMMRGELVACNPGAVRLLAVQPPGGRMMSFAAYRAGHEVEEGTVLRPMDRVTDDR